MSVTAVPLPPVKRANLVWLTAGLILAVLIAVALAWYGTGTVRALKGSNEQFLAWNAGQPGVKSTASGLEYQVVKPGQGPAVVSGDGVAVPIIGHLRDGPVFQPSAPMQVIVDQQPMIPGFIEALKLMNKGAHYRVWLPPKIAYQDAPNPPAELKDQVLIFDIEMNEHISAADLQALRMQQMMQQQQQGGPPPGAGAPPPEGAPQQ